MYVQLPILNYHNHNRNMLMYAKEFNILSGRRQYCYGKLSRNETSESFKKRAQPKPTMMIYLQWRAGNHLHDQKNCKSGGNHYQCFKNNSCYDFCYIVLFICKENTERSPYALTTFTIFLLSFSYRTPAKIFTIILQSK